MTNEVIIFALFVHQSDLLVTRTPLSFLTEGVHIWHNDLSTAYNLQRFQTTNMILESKIRVNYKCMFIISLAARNANISFFDGRCSHLAL